jgi:hypothetical protein
MSPFEIRMALKTLGFSPIPCKGKRPCLPGWPDLAGAEDDTIRRWPGGNTGVLCRNNPALDIDVTHPEAADKVEEVARDWFDGRGELLTRFGMPPKRLIVFRTGTPFQKIEACLEDQAGRTHKLEFLGEGQQCIVAGTHPDTGRPYTWHGDYTPWKVEPEKLVDIEEEEARAFLNYCAEVLSQEFGFRRIELPLAPNGHDPADVDEVLDAMRYHGADGRGINDTHTEAMKLLLNQGMSLDLATDTVLEATRRRAVTDPEMQTWDWDVERQRIAYNGARWLIKNPDMFQLLPDNMRAAAESAAIRGLRPSVMWAKNRPNGGKRGGKIYIVCRGAEKAGGRRTRTGSGGIIDSGASHMGSGDSDAPWNAPEMGGRIEAMPFRPFDPAMLPAREWLYGGHYQRGIITATVGPGGGGKSSLNLVELIAMCTARPLLGEQPLVRCRAWYHNAEDGMEEIYRRIAAVCQHYSIPQEELTDWLFVTSGIEMPIKLAATLGSRLTIDKLTSDAITRTIVNNEVGVASFDPLVAHHAAVENATGDMDQVIREFARIANVTECAVEIVHHTRKPAAGQEELSVIDSRGAGAIINAVRSARVLNTMSKAEAEAASIDDVDRRLHFRIDNGKANMAPPVAARWYKFEGVELPNSDNVGVATFWPFPGQASALGETAEAVFMTILVRMTFEGRPVSERPGPNYAPSVFSKEREAKDAKVGKTALTEAMRRLFYNKRIRVDRERKKGGRDVHVIVMV